MQEKPPSSSRRDFLKKIGSLAVLTVINPKGAFSQMSQIEQVPKTQLIPTSEKFKNGELVYELRNENSERVGEFWPIRGINLVTKETDPEVFSGDLRDIHKRLGGVATAPDGMTGGSLGSYKMEGKSLSNGRECGDGQIKDYGIVIVKKGFDITFTHKKEHENDFDSLYDSVKNEKGTLFFLPSVYRNGKYLNSNNEIDKVLVRRNVPRAPGTPKGEQMGVVIFDKMLSYNKAREAILGLDRTGQSETTHIYVLDGGQAWGQCVKEVNNEIKPIGNRNPEVVTNYLVFY